MHVYVLEVCGGKDTRASNASRMSQREVYMYNVHLQWNGENVPASVVYDNSSDIQRVHLVKEGECVSGPISFAVFEEPDEPVLVFTNPAGDRITWEIP